MSLEGKCYVKVFKIISALNTSVSLKSFSNDLIIPYL